ncbi:MAG: glutamate-5-semialdehyde dehydrogenase [Pseudomonadota bacterium]|nr:glutamate-5-semialdehyde dehydrogenase [Pseudomonadota bacterium]
MNISETMHEIGRNARVCSNILSQLNPAVKTEALLAAADQLFLKQQVIISENQSDLELAKEKKLSAAMLDRLMLDEDRLTKICESLREIAHYPDPVGTVLSRNVRPNGLSIKKVCTPIGVVGVIFESRPNVAIDAGALCIRAGNSAILRCGSESFKTSSVLIELFTQAINSSGLPDFSVQLVPTRERSAVSEMLRMSDYIDVIVPRGGKSLVSLVQEEAKVPVFAHLEGIVHIYVDKDADPQIARDVILNSKVRRPGICGAAECLLIDERFFKSNSLQFLEDLVLAGVEVRGCEKLIGMNGVKKASLSDWGKEYLSMTIAAKVVDNFSQAVDHIRNYGSNHTDCIITENDSVADDFYKKLDSAILMRNTSTQFADGGEFGLGAEIGIATGKLHARGPVGADQLTTFKYIVEGNGQMRD